MLLAQGSGGAEVPVAEVGAADVGCGEGVADDGLDDGGVDADGDVASDSFLGRVPDGPQVQEVFESLRGLVGSGVVEGPRVGGEALLYAGKPNNWTLLDTLTPT